MEQSDDGKNGVIQLKPQTQIGDDSGTRDEEREQTCAKKLLTDGRANGVDLRFAYIKSAQLIGQRLF